MGGRDQKSSRNIDLFSLCCVHGATVPAFEVTRWLADGEVLWLDDRFAPGGALATDADAAARQKVARALESVSRRETAHNSHVSVVSCLFRRPTLRSPLHPGLYPAVTGWFVAATRQITVLHTPGHTADSVSLYQHGERRLFVGDLLYPYTAVGLGSLGASPRDYVASLRKLEAFLAHQEQQRRDADELAARLAEDLATYVVVDDDDTAAAAAASDAPAAGAAPAANTVPEPVAAAQVSVTAAAPATSAAAAAQPPSPPKPLPQPSALSLPPPPSAKARELAALAGMLDGDMACMVHADGLLDFCGGSVAQAFELFLGDPDLAAEVAPPRPAQVAAAAATGSTSTPPPPVAAPMRALASVPGAPPPPAADAPATLACGHVSAELPAAESLAQVRALCRAVQRGEAAPVGPVEDGIGEFSDGTFTLLAPVGSVWD
jgi:hypothetical protein